MAKAVKFQRKDEPLSGLECGKFIIRDGPTAETRNIHNVLVSGKVGTMVLQRVIEGTDIVAHVELNMYGQVEVSWRYRKYNGFWDKLQSIDVREAATLSKLGE